MALGPSTSRLALGPKDWIPKGIPDADPDTDLLAQADRERLEEIYRASRNGLLPATGDVQWLCEELDRVATLRRIDDFAFPEYAAAINVQKHNAFAVRYKSRLVKSTHLEVSGSGEIMRKVFDGISEYSTVLLVRPVFKVLKGDLEKFRELRFQLFVDGLVLLDEPFDRHIISPGDDRLPFTFGCTTEGHGTIYQSGRLDAQQQVPWPNQPLGIFLVKGQEVRIDAVIHGHVEPVLIKASLLGAVYTTESRGGGASVAIRAPGAL